jgi:hypothetical protein
MQRLALSVLLAVLTGILVPCDNAHDASGRILHPPKWIQGCWSTIGESDARIIEWFVFRNDEILRTSGFGSKEEMLSILFNGFIVKERFEPALYRVEFNKKENTRVFEFKLLNKTQFTSYSKGALTFRIVENGKIVQEHSTSGNRLLQPCLLENRSHT